MGSVLVRGAAAQGHAGLSSPGRRVRLKLLQRLRNPIAATTAGSNRSSTR
ncbi:hypothetical protein I545_3024 [Mycobacterium kansasii 662]|uniref:Uncharacterized protein n=2 Tax=Mycobacterium kansasii TaxID=1768 RepID=A0A1V3X3V9_MYCKA|nr:hypothetical protein I547_7242 [Mycobacterium kansasii 824]EUA18602.1 hypothetical protein I545_3024 [Mycobacterium kansasii 662]OOK73983.1 hypothetical protein BZL30_4357 [Mycobacterium kansasii]